MFDSDYDQKEKITFAKRLSDWRLVHLPEVDSTNSYAWKLATSGAPHGLVILADRQTDGRGRRGRNWVAPPGKNLTFSVILRPAMSVNQVPLLSLVAGAAGLSLLLDDLPDLKIKWPNDLFCYGRKLAGILAEASFTGPQLDFVVLGMGLNVNCQAEDFPASLRREAISLQMITGRQYCLLDLLVEFLACLTNCYNECLSHGFDGRWRCLIENHSFLLNKQVVVEIDGIQASGKVVGLDDDGRLQLCGKNGGRITVTAGEATVLAISDSG